MSVRKLSGLLAVISIFFFASSVSAFELTGIPESGKPSFWNNVTIDMNDFGSHNGEGRLNVKGRGDFAFKTAGQKFTGQKVIYKLQAFYNDAGDFLSGNVQIKGGIESLGIDKGSLLMTADITDWNLWESPTLWGFATTNIVCNPLLLVNCTNNESVYVKLLGSAFDGDFANGRFLASGFAVTTVPVPAAAWLFGSALGLLGWVRSRSRRSTQATA